MITGICSSRLAWIKKTACGEVWTSSYESSVSYGDPITHQFPKLAQLSHLIDESPRVYAVDNGVFYVDTPYHSSEGGIVFLDTVDRYALSLAQSDIWHFSSKRRIRYSGTTASAVCHGYFNLFHFLSDFLPRYWLIKQAPFKVDRWLIPNTLPVWGLDLLRIAGMRDEEMVMIAQGTEVISERAVTADATGAATWPAQWVQTAIKQLFPISKVQIKSDQTWLWVSRSRAVRRKWAHEKTALDRILNIGFQVVNMEELSIKEQMCLAQTSKVVAGPHGAGLSWALLTAHENGLLFEVVDDTIVQNSYRALAGVIGWCYARSSASMLKAGKGNRVYDDIISEPSIVLSTLSDALREWKKRS